MDALLEVFRDLYHFVTVERFGLKTLPYPPSRPLLSAALASVERPRTTIGPQVYVAESDVPLHLFPTASLDGVKAYLAYGTPVLVQSTSGRFVKVLAGPLSGWVEKTTLRESVTAVWPQFRTGTIYDAADVETVKLRILIGDEFFAGALELPLQAVEYVYFKLLQKKLTIVWPPIRPRVAGGWQQLLKGQPGIHIGVHPKAGAVLEQVFEDGTGHVAYVEAVFPDQAIRISDVGRDTPGTYTEETVPPAVWREWRPVFIEVIHS